MKSLTVFQAKRSLVSLLMGLSMALFLNSFTVLPAPEMESGGGVIITMDDDFLRTSSDDPDDPIVLIQVFAGSTLVYSENGCHAQECSSDLSALSPGTYTAKAEAESGADASQTIVLQ